MAIKMHFITHSSSLEIFGLFVPWYLTKIRYVTSHRYNLIHMLRILYRTKDPRWYHQVMAYTLLSHLLMWKLPILSFVSPELITSIYLNGNDKAHHFQYPRRRTPNLRRTKLPNSHPNTIFAILGLDVFRIKSNLKGLHSPALQPPLKPHLKPHLKPPEKPFKPQIWLREAQNLLLCIGDDWWYRSEECGMAEIEY